MQGNARACKIAEEIQIGERVVVPYVVTDDDVRKFAEVSGDWNPLHFDDDYASRTIFKRRIAHGLLSLAKFSGIFGMDLPGLGTLWEAQEVRFVGPVFINEPYRAIAEVCAVERRRVTFLTWVEDAAGKQVLEGKGRVIPISAAVRAKLSDVLPG